MTGQSKRHATFLGFQGMQFVRPENWEQKREFWLVHKIIAEISSETKQLINEFYESDEVSRLLPGRKDCVSVKLTYRNREREFKSVCYFLNYLKSTSTLKRRIPMFVGFSTFATLRPKWCVTLSASGSHSECVCTYLQNVRMMLSAVNPALDYKCVLSFCVCDIYNQKCMLHHFDDCPVKLMLNVF